MTRAKRGAKRPAPAERKPSLLPDLAICLILLLATFAVYVQVRHFDFINYDDPGQVSENIHVRDGLSSAGIRWALTSTDDANWFPVTRLSYLLDVQLFGLHAGAMHLTNVFLHGLTALLVFAFLRLTTGTRWRSALVAAMFALHPLNVQSVAWITERKGVLAAFFWFAALLAYMYYAKRPGIGRYLLVALAFCLGLMSKGVVVTLPLALLLLDVWPLRRITLNEKPRASVFWEKIPLLALAIGFTVLAYSLQLHAGALASSSSLPLLLRIGNAFHSYLIYILQLIAPAGLAVFYPYNLALPAWQAAAAAVILMVITVLALRWLRSRPWFAVGWLWYLGTLVPMIGLAQIGAPAHADRYTYLPALGLWLVVAWGAAELAERWPGYKIVIAGVAVLSCIGYLSLTWLEVGYWEDSAALFRRALAVTDGNYIAHNSLGVALRSRGETDEAIANFQKALEIRGDFVDALDNLAEAYDARGRFAEAAQFSRSALAINPANAEAHVNLGSALGGLGQPAEAEAHFREAVRLRTEDPKAHNDLGIALASQGKVSEAVDEFSAAVRLKPDYANAHFNLGAALANSGRLQEAVHHFSEAVRIQPDFQRARDGLESVSARLRESGRH